MKRREFLGLMGGATAWPLAARAQQASVLRIGFLTTRSRDEAVGHTGAFLRGLNEHGYIEGQSVTIEYRWASGRYEQLPVLAAELVSLQPALIVAGGDPAAIIAKRATTNVPIVFIVGDDPVRANLTSSLNRPGGNATGVSLVTSALGAKRVALLSEALPTNNTVALLINPNNPNAEVHTQEVRGAAQELGKELLILEASASNTLESVFQVLIRNKVTALVVQNDPFFDTRRAELVTLAAQHAVAAIYHIREFPAAGGLMSYGPDLADGYYQLGLQAARVLKGADPKHTPVTRSDKFEFVVNVRTVKALGLTIPASLLARADEVIE